MNWFSKFKRWLTASHADTTPAALVDLLITAADSNLVRDDLLAVLNQEPFHRRSLLGSMAHEMELRGASPSAVQALRQLRDDTLAEKVRSYLQSAGPGITD